MFQTLDLWHFCKAGNREAVERLLEYEDIDINMQNHSHKVCIQQTTSMVYFMEEIIVPSYRIGLCFTMHVDLDTMSWRNTYWTEGQRWI